MSWMAWAVELPGVMVYSDAFLKLVVALGLILGAVLFSPGRRLAAVLSARRARAQLGAPIKELDPALDGRQVVLSGRLLGAEASTERFEDGRTALAATIGNAWLRPPLPEQRIAITSTAVGLKLLTGRGEVQLAGPVEVLVGSREFVEPHPLENAAIERRLWRLEPNAEALLSGRRVVARSLDEGEEVLVQGVLFRRQAMDQPEGYRRSAERWVLEGIPDALCPDTGRTPLVAAFIGAPRRRRRRAWLQAATLLLVATLVAASATSGIYDISRFAS